MARNTGRTVYLRSDGMWVNKSNDALRVSGAHARQSDAITEARKMLEAGGGGELTVKNADGIVHGRETIAPGDSPGPETLADHGPFPGRK